MDVQSISYPSMQMFFNQHDVAGRNLVTKAYQVCTSRIGLHRPVSHFAGGSAASSPGGKHPATGYPCRIRDLETELQRPASHWPGVSVFAEDCRKFESATRTI